MTKVYQRIRSVSLILAAIILVATASAKVISVWKLGGPLAGSLGRSNLVLPWLPEGWVLLVAALAECLLATIILRWRSVGGRFGLLAWFSIVCILYRTVLHATDGTASCNCGGVWNEGHQRISDLAGLILLAVLGAIGWVGSAAIVVTRWRQRVVSNNPGSQALTTRITLLARMRHWLGRMAMFWLLISAPLSGMAESPVYYEVELQISQTNYFMRRGDPNAGQAASVTDQRIYSYATRCVFGSEKWLIETHFARNAVSTYYHDGTNVYCVSEPTAEVPDNVSEAFQKRHGIRPATVAEIKASGWGSLTITPGHHPLDGFGASLPWLAFCSGDFLRQPGRLIPFAAEIRHEPQSFGYADKTLTFSDRLGLPERVELFTSKELLRRSPRNPALQRSTRDRHDLSVALNPAIVAPEGFLAGRYQVQVSTNVDGIHIPLVFQLETWRVDRENNPVLQGETWGRVTSLQAVLEPQQIISSTAKFGVIDFRFRHPFKLVDDIQYTITNGIVPPTSDPALRAIYRAEVSAAGLDPVVKARFGIYGLAAVLVVPPVILAALAWRKRTTQKTVSNQLKL